MNTTPASAVELAKAVAEKTAGVKGVVRVVCPPSVALYSVRQAVAGSGVLVAAQNVHAKESGAFTGEVSAQMLEGLADCVIVGHSERRKLFGETDADVAAKVSAAAGRRLRPILCVGEPLDVRQSGRAEQHVRQQLRSSTDGFTGWSYLIVAYEPVWAIGTGQAATPQQAQDMMGAIRLELTALAGKEPVDGFPLLYGGSVTAENAGPFLDRPDVDGALVGGASLKAEDFAKIVQLAAGIASTLK